MTFIAQIQLVLVSLTCQNHNEEQKFPSRTCNIIKGEGGRKSLKAVNKSIFFNSTGLNPRWIQSFTTLLNLKLFEGGCRMPVTDGSICPCNSFRNTSSFGTIQQRWKATALCEFYWAKRFKVAEEHHKILLYQFVLIVLEGTSLWKKIDFSVFSQRDFNSLCTCCHVAKAHKQEMPDTTTLKDQPFSHQ